jgi:predicted HTH transcriptional regulator
MVEVYEDRLEIINPGGLPMDYRKRISGGYQFGGTN